MTKALHGFLLCLVALLTSTVSAQIFDPVKWSASLSKIQNDGKATITYQAIIEDEWHLYSTKQVDEGPVATSFSYTQTEGVEILSDLNPRSTVIEQYEPAFAMTVGWYEKKATFQQLVRIKDKDNFTLKGQVRYMTCNNQNCLPPTTYDFDLSVHNVAAKPAAASPKEDKQPTVKEDQKADVNAAVDIAPIEIKTLGTDSSVAVNVGLENKYERVDTWANVVPEMRSFGSTDVGSANGSLWSIFLTGLLGGLIAIITPCVWPIIPMTVSFFLKRGKDPKKGKRAAIVYGLSIICIYVTLGVIITLIFGASGLNQLSTNSLFNVILFFLLVLFAVSFFGGFEIALPATWSTKLDNKVDKASGLFSILLMAFTLVIVSFSCTGPIIGTLLVDVSMGTGMLAPIIGMLGFAIALAVPFTLFAFFPSLLSGLPRSGGWLNSVKVLLGFFELAFSLKFLSMADLAYGWGVLDREVFIVLWTVILCLAGMYLLGKLQFEGDDTVETISPLRLFLSIGCFSFALYLVPGLWGAPLKAVSAFIPPVSTQDFNLYDGKVSPKFFDYDEALKYAEDKGKPVLIDFTGHACVNCRKMENVVWSDARVSSLLREDFILVSLYTDDRKSLDHPMKVVENGREMTFTTVGDKWSYLERSKFGANAQPFYIVVDKDGKPYNTCFGSTESADEFLQYLRTSLRNWRKSNR